MSLKSMAFRQQKSLNIKSLLTLSFGGKTLQHFCREFHSYLEYIQ